MKNSEMLGGGAEVFTDPLPPDLDLCLRSPSFEDSAKNLRQSAVN